MKTSAWRTTQTPRKILRDPVPKKVNNLGSAVWGKVSDEERTFVHHPCSELGELTPLIDLAHLAIGKRVRTH